MVAQLVEDWNPSVESHPCLGRLSKGDGKGEQKQCGDFLVGGDCSLRAMNWQVSDSES